MPAYYDLYSNPPRENDTESSGLHARVVHGKTVETGQLAQEIQARTTASKADVAGVLTALEELVAEHLKNGKRIYIKGLGYFEMTLECPAVQNPKDLRAESIRFKAVSFRAEKRLRQALETTQFKRIEHKRHSQALAESETERLLSRHFAVHPYITREEFQKISGLTRTTATRRLNEMIKEGKLVKKGFTNFPVYEMLPQDNAFTRRGSSFKE